MIQILILLVVVGIVLYLVENYIPMDAMIKNIIRIVVVLCVCVMLLRFARLM